MDGTIKTILIIHDERKARRALCLSTFFGFCGIWVDQIGANQSQIIGNALNTYDLVLNLWEGQGDIPEERSWKFPVVLVDYGKVISDGNSEKCETVIQHCLESILSVGEWQEDTDFLTMRKLSAIYQEENLRIFDYNGRYYFYDDTLAKDSYIHYKNAYTKINQLDSEEGLNKLMILFARAYCIKCMNNLDILKGNVLAYNVPRVIAALEEAMAEKEYSPAYSFLMGQLLLTMYERADRFPAVKYFERCRYEMKKSGGQFLGFGKLYYTTGNYWEKVREQRDRALEAYRLAYESDPMAFRAVYKLAFHEQDIEKAESLYREILHILENKKQENCLQPMETEYVFKSLSKLEDLYIESNNGRGVRECCEEIESLYRNQKEGNLFYKEFYDQQKSADRACELTSGRITPWRAKEKMENYLNKKIGGIS